MKHQCSNYRDHHAGGWHGEVPCPLCALEKRVEAIELEHDRLRQDMFDPTAKRPSPPFVPQANSLSQPVEPKLYSGFTADEWKQMFAGGPLLCEVEGWNEWIDYFDGNDFRCGRRAKFSNVRLLEQPNWRPHMTNECPVPGRVSVQLWFTTPNGTNGPCGIWVASLANWNQSNRIRAYRILGV